MKLILSKDGVKREITTPFALCASTQDLEAFSDLLKAASRAQGDASYGWTRIDDSHPDPEGPRNTMPRKWTD